MRFWRAFFAVAAAWNFYVAAGMIVNAADVGVQLGIDLHGRTYIIQFAGFVIGAFGVGYSLVAHNPPANRGIVVTGLVAKLSANALATWHFLHHGIAAQIYYFGLGDLVFSGLFAMFLARKR